MERRFERGLNGATPHGVEPASRAATLPGDGQPGSVVIRPLTVVSDLPGLEALWRATWRDTYGAVLGADRLHLIDEAVAEPAVLTMFADDGGGLVAVVGGGIAGSVCFAERHGTGYVWGMYVHPAHQRRGIGTALLQRAAREMDGAERLELSTTTPAAAAFYRRLGFAVEGGSPFELFPGVVRPSTWLGIAARALRDVPPSRGVTPQA